MAGSFGVGVEMCDDNQSPLRRILRLAWPVVLATIFHISYSIVDMLWVSALGREAVAAVTLTGTILWASFALAQVFASGVLALTARAHGAGRHDRIRMVLGSGMVSSAAAAVAVAAVVASWPGELLSLLGATREVAGMGVPYARVMGMGCVGAMTLFTLYSAFRGIGDMITPLILTASSCLMNVVLDPILIFGGGPIPAMGIAGAGIATVASMCFSLVWGLSVAWRRGLLPRPAQWLSVDFAMLADMLVVGLPSGLHYVLLSLTQTASTWMVARFGTAEVAATGICRPIAELSFLPCFGIGAATATMVGQCLGAGRIRDAEHVAITAVKATVAVTAVFSLCYFVFARRLLSMFGPDARTMELAIVYLRLFAVNMVFTSGTIVLTRVFQGAGDTVWPSGIAGVRFAVFALLGWALGWLAGMQAAGVWLAMLLSAATQAVLIVWIFTLGTWKRKRLVSVAPVADQP